MLLEMGSPKIQRPHLPRRNSAERKLPQTSIAQMIEGQPCDRLVVATDEWQIEFGQSPSQINRGQSGCQHGVGHDLIVDPRENAITVPRR